ncbi:hypothetical protein IQ13_4242 [Lacibacter cauensis]|uniref:DUF3945 domain-containing protein n=1 Tax=Lacibacter cauensis TaxID=510947 RepID=A0A562S9N6_9BACT|nr:hypothetical protein [Lacibacter cauensis]TWI77998.1 hypothetical protein IQ13_4242 [Lacibacter cauensis]
MQNEHPLSDEILELAEQALRDGKPFMVYNNSVYFLDKTDVYFFSTLVEAKSFAADNISDHDRFHVLPFNSIPDLLAKIPYGEQLHQPPIIDPDQNGLHNRDGNAFTDALIEHFESKTISEQLNSKNMNQENLQYLSDNLKYMGFGENLKAELEKNMQEGKPEFKLEFFNEIGNKGFEAMLNFRKSDSTDMYFFNNYQATLHRSNGDTVEQTFYLNKGKGVTAKEAFNLLDGRAVHKELLTKEGQPYKAWLQLDFDNKTDKGFEVKQYHENYGYDLKVAVGKFAVAELNDPDKEKALIASLQKGNVQSITIEKDGESHKMFVEANPQFKNVTLYDGNMKMVTKEAMVQYQVNGTGTAKAQKEDIADDKKKDLKPELKTKPEKEKKAEKTLLPKKRESKGKGLGVS